MCNTDSVFTENDKFVTRSRNGDNLQQNLKGGLGKGVYQNNVRMLRKGVGRTITNLTSVLSQKPFDLFTI